jgi:predicted PurR-regulated permease PerM
MPKQIQRLVKIALLLVIFYLLYQLSFVFEPLFAAIGFLFVPVIFAFLFYYLLKPLVELMEKKLPHTASVAIAFVVFLLGIFLMIGSLGFFFINQFDALGEVVMEQYEQYQEDPGNLIPDFLDDYIEVEDVENNITERLSDLTGWLQENFSALFAQLKEIPTQLILVPFLIFYLLKDGHKFYYNLREIMPYQYRTKFVESAEKVNAVLGTYVKGQLIVALFTGVGMLIVYLIVGLPLAPVLAMFAVVTSIIPFIGPILGVLPAIVIALGEGLWVVVQIIIGTIIVQQIESDLISPNVIGKKLDIHPLTIIILVMLAVTIFGIIGAFVVVPAYAAIRAVVEVFYREYQNRREKDYHQKKL